MKENKEERQWTQPSEGDAWNITTYKLVPDLQGDPFVIGYQVP